MSMMDTLVNLAASLVGGGTSGGVLLWMFRHKIGKDTRQIASLKREVAQLKDEKVAQLEQKIATAEGQIGGVREDLEDHKFIIISPFRKCQKHKKTLLKKPDKRFWMPV